MKQGAFIVDRLLPEFVRASAEKRGIRFTGMSDDWVLRLEQGLKLRWVLGYQFDLNTAAASAIAQDKVATYEALHAAGVPAVEHVLVRSLPGEGFPAEKLTQLFAGPFVMKPLDGTGGREVRRVNGVTAAEEIVTESGEPAWAASPLHEIRAEYRVILLDGTPLIAYEKIHPVIEQGLKYFNLGKGALPAEILTEDTRAALEDMARQACAALGLRLASVDIVRLPTGLKVLEVNDGIMMENYARASNTYKKNAGLAYDAILATMFQ